jgi:hypothetical protein
MLAGYNFGPSHPMAPIRLKLTMELAQALGLFGRVAPERRQRGTSSSPYAVGAFLPLGCRR